MMGNGDNPGLIPRLCCSLFERVHRENNESHSFKVEVSYMEIYNEKVRDLLDPKGWVSFKLYLKKLGLNKWMALDQAQPTGHTPPL